MGADKAPADGPSGEKRVQRPVPGATGNIYSFTAI